MTEADTRRLIMADTLLLPLALVAKRLSLELSSCFVINNRTQKPPSPSLVCPSAGNNTTASVSCSINARLARQWR